MTDIFEDASFPLKCGKCGQEFQEKIARLKTDPVIPCPRCGTVTRYDAEDLRAKTRDVNDAVDKLRDAFGKFGKSKQSRIEGCGVHTNSGVYHLALLPRRGGRPAVARVMTHGIGSSA